MYAVGSVSQENLTNASTLEMLSDSVFSFSPSQLHPLNPCVLRAKLLQLCPTFCSPMGCNLPGSSVHGISQARILEWVAMPTSRGSP